MAREASHLTSDELILEARRSLGPGRISLSEQLLEEARARVLLGETVTPLPDRLDLTGDLTDEPEGVRATTMDVAPRVTSTPRRRVPRSEPGSLPKDPFAGRKLRLRRLIPIAVAAILLVNIIGNRDVGSLLEDLWEDITGGPSTDSVTAGSSRPPVEFADFATPGDLVLVGSASQTGGVLSLTRAQSLDQAGAAWLSEPQPVADGFESVFVFDIDAASQQTVGDGFAFVIQNAGQDALGAAGSGNGFEGIPNSVAVEFDTVLHDVELDPSTVDPAETRETFSNHVSVHASGPGSQASSSLGWAGLEPARMSDAGPHIVLVRYEPGELSVFVDDRGPPALTVQLDLRSTLDLGDGGAFAGFTASTEPGFYAGFEILSWSLFFATAS